MTGDFIFFLFLPFRRRKEGSLQEEQDPRFISWRMFRVKKIMGNYRRILPISNMINWKRLRSWPDNYKTREMLVKERINRWHRYGITHWYCKKKIGTSKAWTRDIWVKKWLLALHFHFFQILIRFPNGDRREHSFSCTDKIQSIYRYVDSLGLPGIANYRLVSSFPRKTYSAEQMGMTLKDAGLNPRASLFLEPL